MHTRRRQLIAAAALAALLLGGAALVGGGSPGARRVSPRLAATEEGGATVAALPPAQPTTARGGAVEGVVVDDQDRPVGGAAVLLTGAEPVRSDDAGRFAFRGLVLGPHHLAAHAGRAAAGPLPLFVDDGTQRVTVRLRAGIELVVDVVNVLDGRPLPGARGTLELSSTLGGAGSSATIADRDGRLHFPAFALGNVRVTAEADGFAPASRFLMWNDRAGVAWRARLALEPATAITGRVVDEQGAPVAGARVTSRPAPRERSNVAARPRLPDPLRPPALTGADGTFRYPVPTGQALVLLAAHERYVSGESAPLVATAAVDVTLTLARGALLRGRVVDAAGNPVAGAQVTDGPPEPAPAHVAHSDDAGRFTLAGIDARRGKVVLFAATRDARARPLLVRLPDGLASEIELVVDQRLRLAGAVSDAAGVPVADAVVHFERVVPDGAAPRATRATTLLEAAISGDVCSAVDGSFVIPGLAAGDYRLLARAPTAEAGRASPPLMVMATAAAGAEDVTLTLPAPSGIRGRVVGPGGAPARAFTVALPLFGGEVAVASPDGRFELTGVDPTPGRYALRIVADGAAPAELEAQVAPGRVTDVGTVALEAGRVVRGRVIDGASGGPVPHAELSLDGPEGTRIARARADELGEFAIPTASDPVVIHAAVVGVGGSRFELLPPGRDSVELRVPETGRLEVLLDGPAAGEPHVVTATRTDARDAGLRVFVLERAGDDGRFAAEISPGEYLIHAAPGRSLAAMHRGSRSADVAITVDAGATERLTITVTPEVSAAR